MPHRRSIFFWINFTEAVLFILLAIAVVVGEVLHGASDSITPCCLMWMSPVAWVVMHHEWHLMWRRERKGERGLAVVSLMIAIVSFFLIAVAQWAFGSLMRMGWEGLIPGGILVSLGVYHLWCAWFRLQQKTWPEGPRGFVVGTVEEEDAV